MKVGLQAYFKNYESDIEVTSILVHTDANSVETTTTGDNAKTIFTEGHVLRTYRIRMTVPIDDASFVTSDIFPSETSANTLITVSAPNAPGMQLSSPPLDSEDGRFKIVCPSLVFGEPDYKTRPLSMQDVRHTWNMQYWLETDIPYLGFKIRMTVPMRNGHSKPWKSGWHFYIHMDGFE